MKRIEKAKNRVKSKLEVTIKVSDFKNVEIVLAMNEVESVVKNINVKQRELQQVLVKQKRLSEIWFSFDRREDDLINQEIRTIRALDELNFFSIDNDETELFECFAEISFSLIPELFDFDYSQIFDGFDFSSIPIFPLQHSKGNGPLL